MHKLAFSGLLAAVALSTAALFAQTTPIRLVTVPTAPVLKLKAPPTMTRVAPLSASALAAAMAQARAAYPKAQTATSSGVLTFDGAHWTASAGTLSGTLSLVAPTGVGPDPSSPGSAPLWTMDSNSLVYMQVTGMQSGAIYIVDCGVTASDGTSIPLVICPSTNPMGCMTPGTAIGGNLSVTNSHGLYAFSPTAGTATIALGNMNGLTMTSCSLHPVSN